MPRLRALASRSLLAAVFASLMLPGTSAADPGYPFVDTDGDGLDDGWEIANFGNITSQDQFGDPDGDGANNLQEYTGQTDPLTHDGPGAPTALTPMCGSEIASAQAVLTVDNATDPQGTPLLYQFQLYSDLGLTILIAEGHDIAQGAGATTSWPVPVNLQENTRYYWRARAKDPFTYGPFATPVCSFFVNAVNEAPTTPHLDSPAFDAQVHSFLPTLRVDNATDPDQDILRYRFEVYRDPALSNLAGASMLVPEAGGGTTPWVVPAAAGLVEDRLYYWRARATDPDNVSSAWSVTSQFFVTTINTPPEPPALVSPQHGATVADLRPGLVILNAVDTDRDPLVYDWELARDDAFNLIEQRGADEPPQGGPTSRFHANEDFIEDTRYCWRVRADDGQATSPYVTACFLVSQQNATPSVPMPVRPSQDHGASPTTPVFSWTPAMDPEDDLVMYEIEVKDAGGALVTTASGVVGTVTPIDRPLEQGATYSWRVRATDRPGAASAFSPAEPFRVGRADGCCQTDAGCQATSGSGPGTGLGVGLALALLAGVRRRRSHSH